MPTWVFTSPNGRKLRVTGARVPDQNTLEQLFAQAFPEDSQPSQFSVGAPPEVPRLFPSEPATEPAPSPIADTGTFSVGAPPEVPTEGVLKPTGIERTIEKQFGLETPKIEPPETKGMSVGAPPEVPGLPQPENAPFVALPKLEIKPETPVLGTAEKLALLSNPVFQVGAGIEKMLGNDTLAKLMQLDAKDPVLGAVTRAAVNNALGVVEFVESPLGLGALVAGAVMPIPTALVFAGVMATDLADYAADTIENWEQMTPAQKAEAIVNLAASGALTALAGKVAIQRTAGPLGKPTLLRKSQSAVQMPPNQQVPLPPAMAPVTGQTAPTQTILPGTPTRPLTGGPRYATEERPITESRQPEHPGVPQRPNVPENVEEIRQGPGEPPSGGGGAEGGPPIRLQPPEVQEPPPETPARAAEPVVQPVEPTATRATPTEAAPTSPAETKPTPAPAKPPPESPGQTALPPSPPSTPANTPEQPAPPLEQPSGPAKPAPAPAEISREYSEQVAPLPPRGSAQAATPEPSVLSEKRPTFQRTTPAPKTPERARLEAQYDDYISKLSDLSKKEEAQERKVRESAGNQAAYQKARKTLQKIQDQIATLKKQNESLRAEFEKALSEDRLESPNPILRAREQARLGDTEAYERAKREWMAEAQRQGLPPDEAERMFLDEWAYTISEDLGLSELVKRRTEMAFASERARRFSEEVDAIPNLTPDEVRYAKAFGDNNKYSPDKLSAELDRLKQISRLRAEEAERQRAVVEENRRQENIALAERILATEPSNWEDFVQNETGGEFFTTKKHAQERIAALQAQSPGEYKVYRFENGKRWKPWYTREYAIERARRIIEAEKSRQSQTPSPVAQQSTPKSQAIAGGGGATGGGGPSSQALRVVPETTARVVGAINRLREASKRGLSADTLAAVWRELTRGGKPESAPDVRALTVRVNSVAPDVANSLQQAEEAAKRGDWQTMGRLTDGAKDKALRALPKDATADDFEAVGLEVDAAVAKAEASLPPEARAERRAAREAQEKLKPPEEIAESDKDVDAIADQNLPVDGGVLTIDAKTEFNRVVEGAKPGDTLETNSLGALGVEGKSSTVRGVHVTDDPEYWKRILEEDYGRTDQRVIKVRPAPGDRLIEDPQYAMDPEGGDKAHSAILLTKRKTLKYGVDWVFDDEQFQQPPTWAKQKGRAQAPSPQQPPPSPPQQPPAPPPPPPPPSPRSSQALGIVPKNWSVIRDLLDPDWWKYWWTSGRGVPVDVHRRKVIWEGTKAAFGRTEYILRDLANALRKELNISQLQWTAEGWGSVPKRLLDDIQDVLEGKQPAVILPQSVRPIVIRMRNQIDNLTQRAMQYVDPQLRAILGSHLGEYLTRSYRIFDDPMWLKKIEPQDFDAAVTWLMREHGIARPQAETILREMLADWADIKTSLLRGRKLGSKDLTMFMKRGDIAPEIRKVMGEYRDPVVNYVRTISKLAKFVADHEFLRDVRQMGLGVFLFEPGQSPPGFEHEIAAPSSSVMAPLSGLRTSKLIKRALEEWDAEWQDPGVFLRFLYRLNAWSKGAKTVGSIMTSARNAVQLWFNILNGHYNFRDYKTAAKGVWNDIIGNDQAWQEYYNRATTYGLTDENVLSSQLRECIRDYSGRDWTNASPDEYAFWRILLAGPRAAVKQYRAWDALGKLYGWECEKKIQRDIHPDWTDQQVEAEAAWRVRMTYPTWSMVPNAIQLFRRLPVKGPFAAFWTESVRTMTHSLKYAIDDMRSANARQQVYGAKRLIGWMAATFGIPLGLSYLGRTVYGLSMQTLDDIRKTLPEWERYASIVPLSSVKDGKVHFVNLSWSNPYSFFADALRAAFRGGEEKLWDRISQTVTTFASALYGEQMLWNAVKEASVGVTDEGRRIWDENDSPAEKAWKKLMHIEEALEFGTAVRSRKKIIPAWKHGGQLDYGRRVTAIGETIAEFTGVRIETADFKSYLGYAMRDYAATSRKVAEEFGAKIGKTASVSNEELVKEWVDSEQKRFEEWKKLRDAIQTALRNGVSDNEVKLIARNAGIENADVNSAISGKFVPRQPGGRRGGQKAQRYGRQWPVEEMRRAVEALNLNEVSAPPLTAPPAKNVRENK